MVLGLSAANLLLGLRQSALPVPTIVQNLPDDAFYYFVIARNIADGLGSTFDRVYATNGYHPLWMALLVPFAVANQGREAFLRSALALDAAVLSTSVILLYLVLREVKAHAAPVAFLLTYYALCPRLWVDANNGLETGAMLLCQLTFWLIFERVRREEGDAPTLSWVALGVAAGISALARLDSVLFVVPALVCLGIERTRRVRLAVISLAAAAIFVSPYIAWNFFNFGDIQPASGRAVSVEYASALNQGRLVELLLELVRNLAIALNSVTIRWVVSRSASQLIVGDGGVSLGSAGLGVLVAFLVIGSFVFWSRNRIAGGWPRALRAVAPYLLGSSLFLAYHVFIHGSTRNWYPFSVLPSVTIVIAIVTSSLLSARMSIAPVVFSSLLAIALALAYYTTGYRGQTVYPWQVTMYESAIELGHERQDPIGVWNAGIVGYFYSGRVVNLDGLVNNRVIEFNRRHRIAEYILGEGLEYVGDFSYVVSGDNAAGLEPDLELVPLWEHDGWTLYRVLKK